MKFTKLKEKIVIDEKSGEMLGYIQDIEVNVKANIIIKYIVSDKQGMLSKMFPWFFKSHVYCIEEEQVRSIGNDVILVDIQKSNPTFKNL